MTYPNVFAIYNAKGSSRILFQISKKIRMNDSLLPRLTEDFIDIVSKSYFFNSKPSYIIILAELPVNSYHIFCLFKISYVDDSMVLISLKLII